MLKSANYKESTNYKEQEEEKRKLRLVSECMSCIGEDVYFFKVCWKV